MAMRIRVNRPLGIVNLLTPIQGTMATWWLGPDERGRGRGGKVLGVAGLVLVSVDPWVGGGEMKGQFYTPLQHVCKLPIQTQNTGNIPRGSSVWRRYIYKKKKRREF